jgi:hypothetical protein
MAQLVSCGSLHSLQLYVKDIPDESDELLANAFGTNTTLRKLKLHHNVNASGVVADILWRLGDHPCIHTLE